MSSADLGIFSNIKGLSYYASNPSAEDQDPYVTLENAKGEDENLETEELEILPTDNLIVSAKTSEEVNVLEVHVYEGRDDDEEAVAESEQNDDGNIYVHHDTLLPAMPLCMEWGDCRPSTSAQRGGVNALGDTGSFVAVGTLDKTIEIWDLDVVEGMFPEAILGDLTEEEMAEELAKAAAETAQRQSINGDLAMDGDDALAAVGTSSKKQQKKKKKKKSQLTANPSSSSDPASSSSSPVVTLLSAHTDSVLSLAWNRAHRSLLASSSADSTIKLWDLSSPTCHKAIRSFSLHDGQKVQSIAWNPAEPTILLSGAWGGSIKIFDTRNPDAAIGCSLPAHPGARGSKKANPDVEVLHWDPHSESNAHFYVATGNGQVLYYDSRNLSKPVWTLDAHDGPCSALDVNEYIRGCIVTGGVDKQTKIWNITPGTGKGISLCMSRDFGVVSRLFLLRLSICEIELNDCHMLQGKVFSALFSPDDPTTLALAGSAARLQVWDAFASQGFRSVFGDRLRAISSDAARLFREGGARTRGQGLVGVGEDDNDDDSD